MKNQFIIFLVLLSTSLAANAQEYRLTKSSGQLKLNMSGVIIEGYDGKEIIFSGQKVMTEETTDERAKGLVPISSSKYVDNTGMGINVSDNGQDVNVNLVSKKPIGVLTIKVPQNMKVSIINNSNSFSFAFSHNTSLNINNTANDNKDTDKVVEEVVLRNLKNEVEVSVYNSKIRLENNSGPMNIKTVSGSVDAVFMSDIKGPISIVSVNNYVDVTMPATTKANIEMGSSYGKLFAGKEFKFDLDKIEMETVTTLAAGRTRALNRPGYAATISGNNEIIVTGTAAASASTKAKVTGSGKNKNEAVVVTGHPLGELSAITVNGNQSVNKIVEGVKVENLRTIVNGVEVKGTGAQIVSGSLYTPAFDTFTTRGYYSSGDRIKGKINGGGIDVIFKSTNKNVYLREK